MSLIDMIYFLLRHLRDMANEGANSGGRTNRGSDRSRSLPVSFGYLAVTVHGDGC
jgi:hypothetical protein